jgi:hypothetical protein
MSEGINRGAVVRSRRQILVVATAGITALGVGPLHGMARTKHDVARSAEFIHQDPFLRRTRSVCTRHSRTRNNSRR